jgi:hypothetical protein
MEPIFSEKDFLLGFCQFRKGKMKVAMQLGLFVEKVVDIVHALAVSLTRGSYAMVTIVIHFLTNTSQSFRNIFPRVAMNGRDGIHGH